MSIWHVSRIYYYYPLSTLRIPFIYELICSLYSYILFLCDLLGSTLFVNSLVLFSLWQEISTSILSLMTIKKTHIFKRDPLWMTTSLSRLENRRVLGFFLSSIAYFIYSFHLWVTIISNWIWWVREARRMIDHHLDIFCCDMCCSWMEGWRQWVCIPHPLLFCICILKTLD